MLVAALCCFAGCATHSGVTPMGGGSFMIAKQQATGFPGLGSLKAEIITEGFEHCRKAGRDFKLLTASETQPPYILGNYPRAEITFTCASREGG